MEAGPCEDHCMVLVRALLLSFHQHGNAGVRFREFEPQGGDFMPVYDLTKHFH